MRQVLVCQYVNCVRNGSEQVLAAFRAQHIRTLATGETEIIAAECQGQCNMGPTVRVIPDQVWYCRVKPEDVPEIVESHLENNHPIDRLLHPRFHQK